MEYLLLSKNDFTNNYPVFTYMHIFSLLGRMPLTSKCRHLVGTCHQNLGIILCWGGLTTFLHGTGPNSIARGACPMGSCITFPGGTRPQLHSTLKLIISVQKPVHFISFMYSSFSIPYWTCFYE
jgi:hypothetical protein